MPTPHPFAPRLEHAFTISIEAKEFASMLQDQTAVTSSLLIEEIVIQVGDRQQRSPVVLVLRRRQPLA